METLEEPGAEVPIPVVVTVENVERSHQKGDEEQTPVLEQNQGD